MENNNEETDKNPIKPTITINIPVELSKRKATLVLASIGVDELLPPLENISQINLQIKLEQTS